MAFPLTYAEYVARKPEADSYPQALIEGYLDAAAEAIIAVAGPTIDVSSVTSRVETFTPNGPWIMLSERAMTIVSVLERAHQSSPSTLDSGDYSLSPSGFMLRRLRSGTTPASAWRPLVEVTYVPYSDNALREQVQIALVDLELNHKPGASSERIGEWSETINESATSYADQRASILASLRSDPLVVY